MQQEKQHLSPLCWGEIDVSRLLSTFSSVYVPINIEPGGREEYICVLFCFFQHHSPLPLFILIHHTGMETNKVLMFNGLDLLIPPAVTKLLQLRAA